MAKEYAGKVLFARMNAEENREVPVRYAVIGVPTLLYFRGGELVERTTGPATKESIARMIENLLQ